MKEIYYNMHALNLPEGIIRLYVMSDNNYWSNNQISDNQMCLKKDVNNIFF